MSEETVGVANHPAKAEMEKLWRQNLRATGINEWLESNGYPTVNPQTLGKHGQNNWMDVEEIEIPNELIEASDELRQILDRFKDVGQVTKVVETTSKGPGWQRETEDAKAVTKDQERTVTKVEFTPGKPGDLPLERSVRTEVSLPYVPTHAPTAKRDGWKLGYFIPDMQISFCRLPDGEGFVEGHDERCLDVIHQSMAYDQATWGIDKVVLAGDNLDLPDFNTKFTNSPLFWGNTQMSVDRYALEIAILRALAPDAEGYALEGNHEYRLVKYIANQAPAIVGLHVAEQTQPVMSVPYLCNFAEYGWEDVGPYPTGEVWANDFLRFEHGDGISSTPGATAPKYLNRTASTLHGHTHRKELVARRVTDRHGTRVVQAGSPGCTCKVSGEVPSAKTGLTSAGIQPTNTYENWHQGFATFWYQEDGDQLVDIEFHDVVDGRTRVRGVEFFADEEAIANVRGE